MYYYDSNIFGASVNPTAKSHLDSARIAEPRNIEWDVSLCESLISSETTFGSLVSAFVVQMAMLGKIARVVEAHELSASKGRHQALARSLRVTAQLAPRDIQHVMAALVVPSVYIATDDPDFWDTRLKAGARKGTRTFDILKNFKIEPRKPSQVR